MKRSIRFLAVSLATLFTSHEVAACWEPWYAPEEYYMYRVYESDSADPSPLLEDEENCREWQRLTSPDIPTADIYQAVYKMPLEELERVETHRMGKHDNPFVAWIAQRDTALLDFLLLAKTNEYIRLKRNSRWYYPSMKIGARMTLEEVAEHALSNREPRLRDRYLLQAVRALFTLGRYESCIDLWESEVSRLPADNLMRRLIEPYIAGAEVRTGQAEKALPYFARTGDVGSILFYTGQGSKNVSTVDALSLVCQYAPNSPYITQTLQSYIRSLEVPDTFYPCDTAAIRAEKAKLHDLCMKMARNKETEVPAMWYYTAAFLSGLDGETSQAYRLLRLAERARSNPFIDASIKVFRIYLDARTQPCNRAYERRLFQQLEWLDKQIVNHLTDPVRDETTHGYKLIRCASFYYWNDMMRRIVLSEVCPRMLQADQTTRALQLANMADNRLLGVVGKQEVTLVTTDENGDSQFVQQVLPLDKYRYSGEFNAYDYSNHFFEMIDSLGTDAAIAYVRRVQRPQTAFDRFLNARGYTGNDYLNDIAGTQCLRAMRYGEAIGYLGAVSEAYKRHLNVEAKYDPFAVRATSTENPADFKFAFAREMHSLEQNLQTTREPNRKARLMVRYAIGLRNSFDRCWSLTQYYRGSCYWGQVCEKRDWENDRYTRAALARAEALVRQATDLITDDETGADIHYTLCNFRTVARRYPHTQKGKLVRGHCDHLADYHTEKVGRR